MSISDDGLIEARFLGGPLHGQIQRRSLRDLIPGMTVPIDGGKRGLLTATYRPGRRFEINDLPGYPPRVAIVEMTLEPPQEVLTAEAALNELRKSWGMATIGFGSNRYVRPADWSEPWWPGEIRA